MLIYVELSLPEDGGSTYLRNGTSRIHDTVDHHRKDNCCDSMTGHTLVFTRMAILET
jgi:hypothetical protein